MPRRSFAAGSEGGEAVSPRRPRPLMEQVAGRFDDVRDHCERLDEPNAEVDRYGRPGRGARRLVRAGEPAWAEPTQSAAALEETRAPSVRAGLHRDRREASGHRTRLHAACQGGRDIQRRPVAGRFARMMRRARHPDAIQAWIRNVPGETDAATWCRPGRRASGVPGTQATWRQASTHLSTMLPRSSAHGRVNRDISRPNAQVNLFR